jgi:hypothetical protein
MKKQATFSGIEGASRKRTTKRDAFLCRTDEVAV